MDIITTHKNTDFDALASVMAANLIYPDARCILPKSLNPNVRAFLSIHKDVFTLHEYKDLDLDAVQRLIIVDTNRWDRIDVPHELRTRSAPKLEVILWDHHSGHTDFRPRWQCHRITGATVTLLVEQIKIKNIQMSPIQATLFLAGIHEDTGHLTFSSVTAADAHAAAFLLDNRADVNIMNSFLRPAYGERQKDTLFEMLQSAQRTAINGYKVSINTLDIKGHLPNLAVVVEMYRDITNVDAAFGIFVDRSKKRCMVIGRSRLEELDVGSILRSMGGGGHPAAGSALLKSVKPAAVEEWIMELIQGNQQATVQVSDLMSFPVFKVTADTPMTEVASLLRSKGCTGVPVTDKGVIVGMLSRRDFQRIRKDSQLNAPVKAFMSTNVKTIPPGSSAMQAARMMVKYDIGRLPVVEGSKIFGIVTRSDVMSYFYDMLPD